MGVSVKPIINKPEIKKKICTTCKYRGHLAPDCWGKCEYCGRFGHKSQVCHSKPQQSEPVKKTSKDKNKPKYKKKKTTKNENAKRVAELKEFVETLSLNSPIISSEHESSDSDSSSSRAVNRVQLQQVPQTRRERRTNAYAEISDTEVINSLNRTKMASIIKVKKQKLQGGCLILTEWFLIGSILG